MIKLGHINFLNVLPLTYSLKLNSDDNLQVDYDVPAKLNYAIKNNRLDISQISSIEYARQNQNLQLIPNLCVRADRYVKSIILISKIPIENISSDKITLTNKSATSHCLLKIILSEGYGANPNYKIDRVDVDDPIDDESTATLLIGDDALLVNCNRRENFYYYDIGNEWYKLTGRSMIYALWAVRRNFAINSSSDLKYAYDKIKSGLQNGLKNKKFAIESVINEKPFTYDCLNEYLGGIIKWDLTDESIESLKIFYQSAYKLKLIENLPTIEFVNVC